MQYVLDALHHYHEYKKLHTNTCMSKESLQLDFKNDQFQYKIVRTKVTILCVKTLSEI